MATLTHDLKVPIVAAANMIDLFLAHKFGDISDKQEFALNSMRASNKELLDLVQILLETYKIHEKGISLYKENIDLNSFVAGIVEEMQGIANGVKLQIKFISYKNDFMINADPMQLQRVIKNLISNAIDHSNTKDSIEVQIGQSQNFATISVVDFGQGIA